MGWSLNTVPNRLNGFGRSTTKALFKLTALNPKTYIMFFYGTMSSFMSKDQWNFYFS